MTRTPAKTYDRSYFEKWYRSRDRVHGPGELRRKVAMTVASTEYYLQRQIKNVLDVGCGEAPWFVELRAIRPRVSYIGLDPSEYAVSRFGKSRHVRQASFADLPSLPFASRFDLVICSDVMHYLPDDEIQRGVKALARLTGCAAYLEVVTLEDDIIGDLEGLIRRAAGWYRRTFARAGFVPVGPYLWLSGDVAAHVSELERPS